MCKFAHSVCGNAGINSLGYYVVLVCANFYLNIHSVYVIFAYKYNQKAKKPKPKIGGMGQDFARKVC